jgi:hypothetical protein
VTRRDETVNPYALFLSFMSIKAEARDETRPDRDRDVYALFWSFMSIIISCIKTTVTGN